MKRSGSHPEKALTAVAVKNAKTPGRYADGNGLYLVVDPSGAKRWVLRTVIRRKRCDIGLGGLATVPLAEARETATTYRKIARAGGDPLADKRKGAQLLPTFRSAAQTVHEHHKATWSNGKHTQQWINTLETYAFPIIGDMPVDRVDTPDILRTLSPIWLTKPETARRVRQRIKTVLDWAKAAGFRGGENPVDGVSRGLPKQTDKAVHHQALPYAQVPAFVSKLYASSLGAHTKLAFELLILTATRTSEVLGACWNEMDLEEAIWTIRPDRMKAGRQHRVPLSKRAVQILKEARPLAGTSDLVFPGRSAERSLSNMVFLMALRRMEMSTTAHGFRSAFRDWASENTHYSREICEMALAHSISNKSEAAYRRLDLLDRRRPLMDDWAAYISVKTRTGDVRTDQA